MIIKSNSSNLNKNINNMILSLHTLYIWVSVFLISGLAIVIFTHILSKLFFRKKPLKLDSESIIVITGGCMGIGKQMAIELARLYHSTIIIIDRRKDLFEDVSAEIKKYNGICECLYCDLSDWKSVKKAIDSLKEYRKKIDFFIYNAGVFIPGLTWETSDEQLAITMNVNFFTPAKMVKQLMKQLEGGHIAIVSSVLSIVDGFANASAYIASKHASSAYFNTFRHELKKHNKPITISIGCPYAIKTTMFPGFKTRMPLPALNADYVAQRLVREFISKKEECFVGRKHAFTQRCLNFFPTFLKDGMYIFSDQNKFQKKRIEDLSDKFKKME